MDDADMAQERIEREEKLRLKARAPEGPTAVGYCLFCSQPLRSGLRWCDAECRDAWEMSRRTPR
jgi:hypothetical protein